MPFEQVQKAWRNVVGAIGPPSPVYEWFYKTVRETNLKRRGKHQMRVVLGDPYADSDKIKDREDFGPYLANRDEWYAQVVKDEVLAKNHRAQGCEWARRGSFLGRKITHTHAYDLLWLAVRY